MWRAASKACFLVASLRGWTISECDLHLVFREFALYCCFEETHFPKLYIILLSVFSNRGKQKHLSIHILNCVLLLCWAGKICTQFTQIKKSGINSGINSIFNKGSHLTFSNISMTMLAPPSITKTFHLLSSFGGWRQWAVIARARRIPGACVYLRSLFCLLPPCSVGKEENKPSAANQASYGTKP